jgi:hypothetical protein
VSLWFDFGKTEYAFIIRFGEYGGNLNIAINGDFRNFNNFADINMSSIGGVAVEVTGGLGNDTGLVLLDGVINRVTLTPPGLDTGGVTNFIIGGQELAIDSP